MKPDKKIIFKSDRKTVGESSFSKAFLTQAISQQKTKTDKLLTDTMQISKLATRVDDIETFEKMLADAFDVIVRKALHKKWYSDNLQESIMSFINRTFNGWFAAHFRRGNPSTLLLPDTDFKIHFYRYFKEEFSENFPIFLDLFLQKHNDNKIVPYVVYENLIMDALEDTYTQIDLKYNPEAEDNGETPVDKTPETLRTGQNTDDENGNRQSFLN